MVRGLLRTPPQICEARSGVGDEISTKGHTVLHCGIRGGGRDRAHRRREVGAMTERRKSARRGASIPVLMRRAYGYRGGRKARAAYRRLIAMAKVNPWLGVTEWAAALVMVKQ